MSRDDGPYCPSCDEPVSATASYCMHCYEDLPWAADGESAETWAGDSTGDATDGLTDGATGTLAGESTSGGDGETASAERVAEAAEAMTAGEGGATERESADRSGLTDGPLLDPEGLTDNVLTVLVAIAGSLVIGFVGFMVLVILTESAWALPVGLLAWLFGLAYLARQYSVQETVAKTFYGVAVVLLALPLVAASPGIEESLADRATLFGVMLVSVAVPAGISAVIGYALLSFAPEED